MSKDLVAPDETLSVHTRAPYWKDVPDEKWLSWRWQMSNRLNTLDELGAVINLTDSEREALSAQGLFRVDITPYFASLIDPDDPNCPIRKQVVPHVAELHDPLGVIDPLEEEQHNPAPNVIKVYPDRIAWCVANNCASLCRHCLRKRMVGRENFDFSRGARQEALDYIAATPDIRDVLLTGGVPLNFRKDTSAGSASGSSSAVASIQRASVIVAGVATLMPGMCAYQPSSE